MLAKIKVQLQEISKHKRQILRLIKKLFNPLFKTVNFLFEKWVPILIAIIGFFILYYVAAPDFYVSVNRMDCYFSTAGSPPFSSNISVLELHTGFRHYNSSVFLLANGTPENVSIDFPINPSQPTPLLTQLIDQTILGKVFGIKKRKNPKMIVTANGKVKHGTHEIDIRAIGSDGKEHIGKLFLVVAESPSYNVT